MSCSINKDNELLCKDTKYKTLHLCPIKSGDTLHPLKITATVDGNPMDIQEAEFKVFVYGSEVFTLPTLVTDGVVTVRSVSGEVTSKWKPVVHTYTLTFTLGNGRVVSYLSGNFPVIK